MAIIAKPIPAFYAVYILRSTMNHSSLYIGSTPNPPRRLKQHNGEAKGGANRTSREKLRPWEMVGMVSGFPSMVAALKFEWALTNPHLSLHIPTEERISAPAGKRRNGRPKRPRHSLTSILSNVHLLLRVPSFARWPLGLHFFDSGVYKAWLKYSGSMAGTAPLRVTIGVQTDFGPAADASAGEALSKQTAASDTPGEAGDEALELAKPWGIHALPLDHAPIKDYVAKGHSVFGFEREGRCIHCRGSQDAEHDLLVICSSEGCEGVGHMSCWSRHLLNQQQQSDGCGDAIIPIVGSCPSCKGEVRWVDMMKELSLRLRGKKDVEKLLKPPRRKAKPRVVAE